MHYDGNLTITEANKHEYANLTSVGGWLEVRAEFDAPNLTSVWGYLCVRAEFDAPNLTMVGDDLYVRAEFDAPNLTSVSGWLGIHSEFDALNLTQIEGEAITKFDYILNLHWPVLITDNYIRIGCQRHTKARWAEFTDDQIGAMDEEALAFWIKHKELILSK